jgi:2-haloacid dehalogenase
VLLIYFAAQKVISMLSQTTTLMNKEPISRPQVLLLDVYETLLNMAEVERRVNALLDSRRGYTLWFELFMQYCFVDNCTVQFNDFSSIAKATMQMAAHTLHRSVNDYDISDVLDLLKQLPVQDGVPEGLSLLNNAGFRLAALTNSPEQIVRHRMNRTGIISYFDMVLSAEQVKKYKPCLEVYTWAAQQMDAEPRDVLVVSAHGWDIAGAANAGMQTAYMKQGRQMLYPLAPAPTFTCTTLADLANQLQHLKESQEDGILNTL